MAQAKNSAANPKFDLASPKLFGNDAAEEEHENIFSSYAVERDELKDFMNSENPFQIARAYKGEGKSALLRLVRTKLIREGSDEIVATTTGPDLSPPLDSTDHDLWVREWKKSILRIVANEIGSRIGLAFGDDAISLVEESEASGFKKRSFVSAIVDRLSSSAVPIKKSTIAVTNHEKLVKRYLDGRPLIWLIVDDVDLNFANTEKQRLKTATFFTACRQIIGAIPEIRIRTAIRPNVWSIIKREFESLSHVEQYSHDLTWSIDQFRSLLAARVRAELIRSNRWNTISSTLPQETFLREKALVGFVFDDPMPWGGGDRKRPPHVVLFTMTGHRPRWLVELCKEAGKEAAKRGRQRINYDDIQAQFASFGRRRIEDTVAEFKSQCPQIEELIGAFSRQKDLYATDDLLTTIHNRITPAVNVSLVGVSGKASDVDVAHFLFQIGFIAGRRDFGNDEYEHVMYRDNPSLLRVRTNLDDGLRWEINPVYRDVLNIIRIPSKATTSGPTKK